VALSHIPNLEACGCPGHFGLNRVGLRLLVSRALSSVSLFSSVHIMIIFRLAVLAHIINNVLCSQVDDLSRLLLDQACCWSHSIQTVISEAMRHFNSDLPITKRGFVLASYTGRYSFCLWSKGCLAVNSVTSFQSCFVPTGYLVSSHCALW
jgi:hypothetical protein